METQTTEKKPLEEAELTITLFDEKDNIAIATSDSCLAKGTKITMADGTFKNIEDVVKGDKALVYDHEIGCLTSKDVIFTFKSNYEDSVFVLTFDDETTLSLVNKHYLFEKESNKYVCFTIQNAVQYIDKHFYNATQNKFIKLVSVTNANEKSYLYTIYTKNNINYIANGMLNVSDDVVYILNIYEFDENLKANPDVLKQDIEKYGIFEFNHYPGYSLEEYHDWNARYLNIAIGKGLTTWNDILTIRNRYEELKI